MGRCAAVQKPIAKTRKVPTNKRAASIAIVGILRVELKISVALNKSYRKHIEARGKTSPISEFGRVQFEPSYARKPRSA
jgi:hypothetical protein